MLDGGILTEGKAITEETGIKLEGVRLEDLGRAKRVTVDKDNTTLVDGAGGGALLRASKALEKLKMPGDEQIGVDTVRRACEDPVRQIVVNSGTEGKIVVEKIRENNNPNFGFNATETQVQDRQAFHAVA